MTAEILPFNLWTVAQATAERLGLYAVFTTEAAESIPEALEVAPADIPPGTPADRWGPNWTIYRNPVGSSGFLCDNIGTGDQRIFSSIGAALAWIAAERKAGRRHLGESWAALIG